MGGCGELVDFGCGWGLTHPDVVLAQPLPQVISLGVDRYHHMVDSLWNRVLAL